MINIIFKAKLVELDSNSMLEVPSLNPEGDEINISGDCRSQLLAKRGRKLGNDLPPKNNLGGGGSKLQDHLLLFNRIFLTESKHNQIMPWYAGS